MPVSSAILLAPGFFSDPHQKVVPFSVFPIQGTFLLPSGRPRWPKGDAGDTMVPAQDGAHGGEASRAIPSALVSHRPHLPAGRRRRDGLPGPTPPVARPSKGTSWQESRSLPSAGRSIDRKTIANKDCRPDTPALCIYPAFAALIDKETRAIYHYF